MTSIGAIQVRNIDGGDISQNPLVFVADSMGSQIASKNDNAQKIIPVGRHILMGAGGAHYIYRTASQLNENPPKNADELAKAVLEITDSFRLTEEDTLNFIVGGPLENGFRIFHINTTGNDQEVKGTADYGQRGIHPAEHVFDGSGRQRVISYHDGLDRGGKPVFVNDIADTLTHAHDLAKATARDIGVNDKLQYATIDSNGTSVLFHPDIHLLDFDGYVKMMTGFDLPERDGIALDATADKRQVMADALRNIFRCLSTDLDDYVETRRNFTAAAEFYGSDRVDVGVLRDYKKRRNEARKNVVEGVAAMVSRDLGGLIGYVNRFDSRQNQTHTRALSYARVKPT